MERPRSWQQKRSRRTLDDWGIVGVLDKKGKIEKIYT
jgi:hypothetical protein